MRILKNSASARKIIKGNLTIIINHLQELNKKELLFIDKKDNFDVVANYILNNIFNDFINKFKAMQKLLKVELNIDIDKDSFFISNNLILFKDEIIEKDD